MPRSTSLGQGGSSGMSYGYNQGENYGYSIGESQSTGTQDSTSQSQTRTDPGLMQRFDQWYGSAQGRNDDIYGRVQAAYPGVLDRTAQAADRINTGYGNLNAQVQAGLAGTGRAQQQAIDEQYARARGDMRQSMASRGLGNTTVRDSMDRGLLADKMKAEIALSDAQARQSAGYTAQLGSQGLNAYGQAMGLDASTGNNYMGVLTGNRQQLPSWAPLVSDSSSVSTGRNQSTSSNQSEQWGMNQGENASTNNSYNFNFSQTPQSSGGGGGYYPQPTSPPPTAPGWPGGGGDFGSPASPSTTTNTTANNTGTYNYGGTTGGDIYTTGGYLPDGSQVFTTPGSQNPPVVPGPGGPVSPNPNYPGNPYTPPGYSPWDPYGINTGRIYTYQPPTQPGGYNWSGR